MRPLAMRNLISTHRNLILLISRPFLNQFDKNKRHNVHFAFFHRLKIQRLKFEINVVFCNGLIQIKRQNIR